jgi:biotin operon repressor
VNDWPEQIAAISGPELSKAVSIFQQAAGPMTAIEIATKLGLEGCRESQRRRVRAIIEELRNKGWPIAANQKDGCWMAKNAAEWRQYLEGRKIDAKQQIGEAHRRKKCTYDDGTIAMFGQQVGTGIG